MRSIVPDRNSTYVYTAFFLLIFSLMWPALSWAAPRLAVYGFSQNGDTSNRQYASAISSLLLEKLSTQDWVISLDRSLILDVFDEKALTISQASSSHQQPDFNKISPSDYVIVGKLIITDSEKTLFIDLVDVDTGELVRKFTIHINSLPMDRIVNDLVSGIKAELIDNQRRKKQRLNIAASVFVNEKSRLNNDVQGNLIHTKLIDRYIKEDGIRVLSRSYMYPLFLEAYFRDLQYTNKSTSSMRPSADILIQGSYTKLNDQIELIISIHVFEKTTIIKSFRDTSWNGLQESMYRYLDSLLINKPPSMATLSTYGAEILYQQVIQLCKYKLGRFGQHQGKSWRFPKLSWSNQHEVLSDKVIALLGKALELNPRHYEARLLLAYYLLQKSDSSEALANRHLHWLMIHSDKAPVQERALQMARDFQITSSAFSDVVDGDKTRSQLIFRKLINSGLLSAKGEKTYLFDDLSSHSKLPLEGLTIGQNMEIYNIIMEMKRYSGVKRTTAQSVFNNQLINAEAQLNFNHADQLGEFKATSYGRNIPRVEISDKAFKPGNEHILTSIINQLSTVLYIDPNMDIAKIYLAKHFEKLGNNYQYHAKLLNRSLLKTAKNDKIRFLATDGAEDISDANFSGDFFRYLARSDIFIQQHRSILIKAKKQYLEDSSEKNRNYLLSQYRNSISEGCQFHGMENIHKKIKQQWKKFFAWMLLEMQDVDDKLTESMHKDAPIMSFIKWQCSGPQSSQSDDDTGTKPSHSATFPSDNSVANSNKSPVDSRSGGSNRHIEYARPVSSIEKIMIEPFTLADRSGIFPLHSSMVDSYDNFMVASNRGRLTSEYLNFYNHENGEWNEHQSIKKRRGEYPRNLAHAVLDLHERYLIIGTMYERANTRLTPENFKNWGLARRHNPGQIIAQLFDKGYLDVFSRVTQRFTGKLKDLMNDFPDLKQEEAQSLMGIIRSTMKIKDVGAAYVFHLNADGQWEPEGPLYPLDAIEEGYFGIKVAIHNEIAIVCSKGTSHSRLKDNVPQGTGGAYLFIRNDGQWHQQAKILAGRCNSAAITDQHAFITQVHYNDGFSEVHIFNRSGNRLEPAQVAPLKPADSASTIIGFGASLAANEHFLAIGHPAAPSSDFGAQFNTSGAVYLYRQDKNGWNLQQKLVIDGSRKQGSKFAEFGAALSLQGDSLVVGAPGKSHGTDEQGAFGEAYLYRLTTDGWRLSQVIGAADAALHDKFGASVSVTASTLVIGAIRNDGKGKLYALDRQ